MGTMNIRSCAVMVLAISLVACKSVDGTYLPGCKAFAGDRIELDDGSFHWDRFTDSVEVDGDGNVVDPYPAYPLRGRYDIDGRTLTLTSEAGDPVAVLHMLRLEDGGLALLTDRQLAEQDTSGHYDECALTRIGAPLEED